MIEAGGTLEEPRVRVRIEVAGEEPAEEVPRLVKSTKGRDIFEVDGFVFKKRKTSVAKGGEENRAPPPEGITASPLEPQDPPPGQEAGTTSQRKGSRALEFCQEASRRVMDLFLSRDKSEHDTAEGASAATEAVDAALKRWMALVQKDLASKGNTQEPQLETEDACDAAFTYRKDIEAGQAIEGDASLNKSMLRAVLSTLREEEQEWLRLQKEHGDASCDGDVVPQGEADEMSEWTSMESAFTAGEGTTAAQEELAAAWRDAHTRLSLQVEAYTGLVSGVEALVLRAEQSCQLLQEEYHKQRFKAFPHVNSPASLIRGLARQAGKN